ncbi:hypothetical protein HHK36_027660 [Tetracentron sinense]|uniref:Uncharacterized protein n=1 Tax=Tetracentron sinense TaxID=13715 RepID=A0A834YED3_TETSI|nr:hypothetical protein HHK36_027660 [Tetracentron sinense]
MRKTIALSSARNILKQIHPLRGSCGEMATSAPKKQGNNDFGEAKGPIMDDKAEPIVAFSKPPLPPLLGPLVVLSLLEMGSNGESNEDC